MEDPSHGFLANRWLVHNQFMGLSNPLEVIVHYLVIGMMDGLGYWDGFPMVSALMCVVILWIGPTVSHDLRLSSSHDLPKLLCCVVFQPWGNIEFVLKLVVALTYQWYHKLIIYSLWIRSLLMKVIMVFSIKIPWYLMGFWQCVPLGYLKEVCSWKLWSY